MTRPEVVRGLLTALALEDIGEPERALTERGVLDRESPPTDLERAEANRQWRDDPFMRSTIQAVVRRVRAADDLKPRLRLVTDGGSDDRV